AALEKIDARSASGAKAHPATSKMSDLKVRPPVEEDAGLEFGEELALADEKDGDIVEVAIIGRPNVGKSTLLNRMVGEERTIVSPIPGTTMDNVDLEITREGRGYRF